MRRLLAFSLVLAGCSGSSHVSNSGGETPDDTQSSLTTDAPASGVTADGSASATLTVVARGSTGAPIAGASVSLSVSGSGNSLVQPPPTDATGTTTATLSSLKAENKLITARIGSLTLSRTVSVLFIKDPRQVLGPSTSFVSTPPPVSGPAVTFAFVSSASGSTFLCSLDSAPALPCTSPVSLSGLATGSHKFGATAVDPTGTPDAAPPSFTWAVDATAPVTTLTAHPSNPSASASATFTFTSSETPPRFVCTLDGAGPSACTSPRTVSLADGAHTFVVAAVDQVGNVDPSPPSFSWTIATVAAVAPVSQILSGPSDPSRSTGASFFFSGAPASATFSCALDGAAAAACTSPQVYAGLAQGAHTFVLSASAGGVTEATPHTVHWTIDSIPPLTQITSGPLAITRATVPIFAFTSSKTPSTFACRIDGGALFPCTSPYTGTALPDGVHTFLVAATDASGNTEATPPFVSWTIDTVPPTAAITARPPALGNVAAPSFSFTSNEQGSVFLCSVDSAAGAGCASPHTLAPVGDGPHSFSVIAIDAAGNHSEQVNAVFTVDATAPVTTITAQPPAVTDQSTVSISFTSSEAPAHFLCTLDGAGPEACISPRFAAVGGGAHSFTVAAVDEAGNVDPAPPTVAWTSTAPTGGSGGPTAWITNGPNDPSRSTSASFWFNGTLSATFSCALDGATPAACTSPQSYTGLSQGSHAFVVIASLNGVADAHPPTYTWKIDSVPPSTQITGRPPVLSAVAAPTFTFTSSKPSSSFSCRIDAGPLFGCSSPYTGPALSDGAHLFLVAATDAAGNTDPYPPTASWTLDTTPPVASIGSKPPALTNGTAPSFTFSSSESGSTFTCALDSAAAAPCTSPRSYAGLADGAHVFAVVASDPAGNASAPATWSWTVDTAAPVATIDTASEPPALTNVTSASFGFSSNKAGSFTCRLDGGSYAACTSPKSYGGLGSAAHTFFVIATDTAGNASSPASYSWTVDTVAPLPSITAHPTNPSNQTDPSFSFSSNESGGTFTCSLDGATASACTSPQVFHGLGAGPHSVAVSAIDAAGNPSAAPATFSWVIDLVAPTASITAQPANPSKVTSPSFSFTSSESGSTFTCQLDTAAAAGCTSPKSYPGTPDGQHTFTVIAIDPAGNSSAPVSYAWTLDTVLPVVTFDPASLPPSITNVTSASFAFTSSKPGTFTCKLDSGSFASCTSPKTLSGLGSAAHTFSVIATDAAGNASATASSSWTVDTALPTVSITAKPGNPSKLPTPSFSFTSSKSGSVFTCTVDGGAGATCTSPFTTAALTDAPHTFSVQALDPAGNSASASYAWTVDTTPPVQPAPIAAQALNRSARITWTAVSDAVSYKVYSGTTPSFGTVASGLTGTSATISSLINCGTYYFTVTAVDAAGNESDQPAPITASPQLPAPATATVNGAAGVVTVSWSAVTSATSYSVQYGPTPGGPYTGNGSTTGASPLATSATSLVLSGFAPYQHQYLTVFANDGTCAGAPSAELATDPYPWKWVNPGPTVNTLFGISCTDASHCVAVGALGAILATADAGATWSQQNAGGSGTFTDVWMVSGGPSGVGYAISGNAVYKTTNGGAIWAPTAATGTSQTLNGVAFANATTGIAVGNNGAIVATVNGGTSWTVQTSGTLGNLMSVWFGPDGVTAYAVGQSAKTLATVNGGATWTSQNNLGSGYLQSIWCVSATQCWAAGDSGVINATINGGSTWTSESSGTSSQLLRVRFADANTGWVVGASGTLRNTTTGGSSWAAQTSGESGTLYGLAVIDGVTAWFAGTSGKLRMTTDGATWTSQSTNLTTADLRAVAWPSASTGVIVGAGGLVLRSTNGGSSFAPVTSGFGGNSVNSVFFADANTGFIVGASGKIARSLDGGATWTLQTSNTSSVLNSVYCLNANTCWSGGNGSTIVRTTDGGQNWVVKSAFGQIQGLFFADYLHGVLAFPNTCGNGCYSGTAYTIDGDIWSWPNYYSNGMSVYCKDANTCWMAGGGGSNGCGGTQDSAAVHKSTNGGATWSRDAGSMPSGGDCLNSLAYVSDTEMYAVGGHDEWAKKGASGSWTPLTPVTSGVNMYGIARQSPGKFWVVGSNGTILVTETGGQ